MKRQKGFTLVELLVVMAIISILAAIAVPNAIKYIAKGRATRARADISTIEGALVKMLSDSGRGKLEQLFDSNAVNAALGVTPGTMLSAEGYKNAVQLYSNCLYALIREGRGATVVTTPVFDGGPQVQTVLNKNAVAKLGTTYVDLGFDPWGNLYNIYPGPWPSNNNKLGNAIPFRKYFPESKTSGNGQTLPGRGDSDDAFTLEAIDPDTNESLKIGYPAARDRIAFVWSAGENLVSGQGIYGADIPVDPDPQSNAQNHYDVAANQDLTLCGGGDDINNWDKGESWSRFY